MNRTLFDCGFKKEVELKNGKLYDVTATLPKAVQKQNCDFQCGICSQTFFRKQHLEMHIKFKHPVQDQAPAKADLQNGHSVGQSGSSAASTCSISLYSRAILKRRKYFSLVSAEKMCGKALRMVDRADLNGKAHLTT